MRKAKKAGILLAAGLLSLTMLPVPAAADSVVVQGNCVFNGSEIVSDFSTGVLVEAIQNLQPGDDVTFAVRYENGSSASTDWYMENEILQTLEKTTAAKKIAGAGVAQGGGYQYKLIHYDKNGNQEILFGDKNEATGLEGEVGGDATPGGLEGLEQATNATEEWFYIQTLEKGEYGIVELYVAFDGETEVNDYMDTDGGLAVRFAVEVDEVPPKQRVERKTIKTVTGVNTGDAAQIVPFVILLAAGAALLVIVLFVFRKRRKNQGTGGNEE